MAQLLVRQFKCTKQNKLKLLLVFTILTSQSYSQNLNKEQLDEMAKIFGYHYGQSRSIELITNKFPGLSRDFLIAEIEWNKKFKPSVTRVETELSELIGKEWSGIKNSLMSQFDKIINKDISYVESLEFLSEMRERSKGVMDPSILDLLLKYHPKYISQPAFEFSNGYIQNYRCANCDKSQGLSFSFDYPESWISRDGKRSMVLFLMKSPDMGIMLTCTIIDLANSFTFWEKLLVYLSDAPTDEVLSEVLFNDEGINLILDEIAGSSYTIIEQKNTRLNTKPCYMVDFSMEMQQLDFNLVSLNRMYLVITDGKIFNFSFQVFKTLDKSKTEHTSLFEKYKPLMLMVTNSVIFQ